MYDPRRTSTGTSLGLRANARYGDLQASLSHLRRIGEGAEGGAPHSGQRGEDTVVTDGVVGECFNV